jgi:integrase
MKRVRTITKRTGRKSMRVGAILIKEVAYTPDDWRVQATWRNPARKKKWFNNWRAAEEFARKEDARLVAMKEKGAGRYTFDDAADSYIKACEQRQRAKDSDLGLDTLEVYRSEIEKTLIPKFGGRRLETITRQEVQGWVRELRAGNELRQGYAFRTTDRFLIKLNAILDHAVEHGMLGANPMRAGKRIKVPGTVTKRAFIPDRSDLEVLRKYLTEPRPLKNGRLKWSCLRVMVLLGASCGMSAGEVAGLRWDSIDPDTGEIEIKEARANRAGLKGPKTPSRYRKVPLTLRARDIINEHAVIYKQLEGKCVGPVLRTRDMPHLRPHMVGAWFREVMNECGLVKPDSKPDPHGHRRPKFTFHALRHWCASHWLKATRGDVHQSVKWLGHKHASMTLDVYGHALDDPEAREKFLRIPDWLNPTVEIDAPSSVQSVEIAEPLALPAPDEPLEFDSGAKVIAQVECPIDVPDIAKPWVKPFIMMLANGSTIPVAYRAIESQVEPGLRERTSVDAAVRAEFRRLKMPTPKVIAARIRDERILALHGQKHQMHDIARMVGCGYSVVHRALQSRHKSNANNPLNRKIYLNPHLARKPQPKHKEQLKLL